MSESSLPCSSANNSSLKDEFLQHLNQSMRDIDRTSWPRLLRMFGYPEHEVQRQIERKYNDKPRLVKLWGKTVGFTQEMIRCLSCLNDEIYKKEKNDGMDNILSAPRAKKFRWYRDRAWVMYRYINQFSPSDWEEFAKRKLGISESQISQTKQNFDGNCEEQQFRTLLHWVKIHKLGSPKAIYEKLTSIENAASSPPTNDETISDTDSVTSVGTDEEPTSPPPANRTRRQNLTNEGMNKSVELREQLRSCPHIQSFRTSNLVDVQIMKYESHDREKFGKNFHGRSEMETQNTSSTFYDGLTLFEEAKKLDQKFLGIVGEPGVGKTSLVQKLLKHFATDPASSTDHGPFLFYLPFRGLDFTKETTVFELLIKSLLPSWDSDLTRDRALLKIISNSPDVYLFIDGLDEAKDELFSSPLTTIGLYEPATPDAIVKNLFSGRLFPNAKKLVTSRPDAFLNLTSECKPKFNVKILGLSKDSQKLLCRQVCDDNEQEYLKVQEKFDASPDLSTLCYIPLYCKMIAKHLRKRPETDASERVTSSSIFTETFADYVRSSHRRGQVALLQALTELALNGMKRHKFIFETTDLKGVDKKSLKNFVDIYTNSPVDVEAEVLDGDKRFFFTHLLWQEYLAAVHLMFFADLEEFSTVLSVLDENRWITVVKFAFGCHGEKVRGKLNDTFQSVAKTDLFPEKYDKLKAHVIQRLKNSQQKRE